jgi:hypothetical protein
MPALPQLQRIIGFPGGVEDLTDRVVSLSWTESVNQPWGGIKAVLKYRLSELDRVPYKGDWLVVRDAAGKALAWGYVARRGARLALGGRNRDALTVTPVVVEAIPWLAFLGRLQVFVAPKASEGTLLSYQDWADPVSGPWTQFNRTLAGDVGDALADVMEVLPRVLLPHGLGGEMVSGAIRVAHNALTSEAFSPDRIVEAVRGPSLSGPYVGLSRGASVLDLLLSTFGADSNMVELFPSLERPGVAAISGARRDLPAAIKEKYDQRFADAAGVGVEELTVGGRKISLGSDEFASQTMSAAEAGLSKAIASHKAQVLAAGDPPGATGAARALGRNPVLVYRMRPWRSAPLTDLISQNPFSEPDTDSLIELKALTAISFSEVTWRPEQAVVVPLQHILDLPMDSDDSMLVNATTVGLPMNPDSEVRFMTQLPLIASKSVSRRGLRLFQPAWPFFPPLDDRTKLTWMDSLVTLAAQAAQFMAGADRFEAGTASVHFSPRVRHGEVVRFEVPKGMPGDGYLTAYAESVTHTFEVDQERGTIRATTAVQYSRGLLDESRRNVPFSSEHGGFGAT